MILIHRKTGKKFLVKELRDINTNFGIIKKEDLEKAKNGDIILSHLGEEFLVLEKSFIDEVKFIKRKTQVTHWKDISIILGITGISSGWRVVEGGSGSGYLTSFLANIVKPNGVVYSYEVRKEFYDIAKENIEKLGLDKYVVLKLKDIREGIDEEDVDLVLLDIPDPWNVIENSYKALKKGGFFISLLPNITSVYKLCEENNKFLLIGIYENIVREWKYDKMVLRPKNKQLVHTEFIVVFRKI